jgi:hypothetical protein
LREYWGLAGRGAGTGTTEKLKSSLKEVYRTLQRDNTSFTTGCKEIKEQHICIITLV